MLILVTTMNYCETIVGFYMFWMMNEKCVYFYSEIFNDCCLKIFFLFFIVKDLSHFCIFHHHHNYLTVF